MALYFNGTEIPTLENDLKYNDSEMKEVVFNGTTVWIKETAKFPNWGLTWSGNLILTITAENGGAAEEQYSGMTALADSDKYWIQADAQAGAVYYSTGQDLGYPLSELYASKSGSSNNLPWTVSFDQSGTLALPYVSSGTCWQSAHLPPVFSSYGYYFVPYFRVTNVYLKNK